jgi:hypothetical protein
LAVFDAVLVPAQEAPLKVAALAASTSSAEQSLGKNTIFAINATKDITIKFGVTGMGAAAATDFRIPTNATMTFDTGEAYTHIRVFNLDGAATADIYITKLSRV